MRGQRWTSETVHHSGYPVAPMRDIEIQQIAQLVSAESQIAQELPAMHRPDRLLRFQFNDNTQRPLR